MIQPKPYINAKPYIPASISEINDQLGSMFLWAPTFKDKALVFPDRDLESEFYELFEGLGVVRKKLGEQRYTQLVDLAARSKTLFAADQDDNNGKTDEGRELLCQMQDVLRDVRRSRVKAQAPDDDGEISGD